MPGMPVVVVAVFAATVTSCSGCGAATGAPVRGVLPSITPTVQVRSGACWTSGASTRQQGGGLVAVGPHSTGVVAVWVPGLNQRPCRAVITRVTKESAGLLAADILSAPKVPPGRFSCPMDDGTHVRLYFTYSGAAEPERVDVALTGCTDISAPDRAARRVTGQLARDLAPFAPMPWRDRIDKVSH
jgi:hypothetical protein